MATAAKTQFSLEDYIGHSFHPDCDFVADSEMQVNVVAWFVKHGQESIKVLPEMRMQASVSRYRVANIAILSVNAPREKIITTPPLLVIEILSPEDRRPRYTQ